MVNSGKSSKKSIKFLHSDLYHILWFSSDTGASMVKPRTNIHEYHILIHVQG